MEKDINMNSSEVLKLVSDLINKKVNFEIRISVNQNKIGSNKVNLQVDKSTESLEETVENVMNYIGVPEDLQGYECIKEAVMLIYNNDSLKKDIVRGVYASLAEKLNTTQNEVERAIRYSIKATFGKSKYKEKRENIFGHIIDENKSLPTNRQFLAVVVKMVKKTRND